MVAGSVSAHAVGYRSFGAGAPARGPEEGGAASERLAGVAHPLLTKLPILVGVVAAIALVTICVRIATRHRGRRATGASPGWFFFLPFAALAFQELAERAIHGESFPFNPAHEPAFLVALLLQLPFGLIAFFLARALLAIGTRICQRLSGAAEVRRAHAGGTRVVLPSVTVPHRPLLTQGHSVRGPPMPHRPPGFGIEPLAA
jgi:hypothetical protein